MAVIKIQGEEPFQVNAHSFIASPSAEGYTLQYSADGDGYTDWTEATPANETLNVFGNAFGAYFRLKGNASEITVRY